ncbi:MAG: hypothetical protein ABIO49_03405 [Dokdonella sp.]
MTATTAQLGIPILSPLRLARSFEFGNRLRAFHALNATKRILAATAVAVAAAVSIVGGYRLCKDADWLLDPLQTHLPVVALATALMVRSGVARARQQGEHRFATSWLAVAPVDPREVTAAIRERVFVRVVLVLGSAIAFVGSTGWINATPVGSVIAALLAGGIPGALAGWWSGRRPARRGVDGAPRIGRLGPERDHVICLTALGRWAFAERFSALRPRVDARVFGAALLSMPMGIPPLVAILLLLSLVIVVVATTLLKAQLAVIPRAADWLRATPLALNAFTVSSCARVFLWQCGYAIAIALPLAALHAGPRAILATTSGWLAWVALAMVTAMVCRYRPGRLRIELFACAALLAGAATVAAPLALTVWAAAAIIQWKRAEAA